MQLLSTHAPGAITLTPTAIAFVQRMIRLSGIGTGAGFRLVVVEGGCSGLQESFSIERAPHADDDVLSFGAATLFVPRSSRVLLDGVTIDFIDTPTKTGFAFHDPKAGSCGCS